MKDQEKWEEEKWIKIKNEAKDKNPKEIINWFMLQEQCTWTKQIEQTNNSDSELNMYKLRWNIIFS